MNCYTCAQAGATEDAVAVCSVCGAGLCRDHAQEHEISLTERAGTMVSGWERDTTRNILCDICSEAMGQAA